MPTPQQPRELSEQEFTAIRDRLLDAAPDGLSEAEFHRWIGPRLEAAVGEAENRPAPAEGSTLRRFAGNAWEQVNPVALAKGLYAAAPIPQALGGSGIIKGPVGAVKGIASQMGEQVQKGAQAGREGRYSEALAHTILGAVPIVGPMIGNASEQIGSGDVAGGLGALAGIAAAPKVYAGAARGARGAAQGAANVGRRMTANANPAVAEAVSYGLREGIPVDLATATGNPAVRGAQYLADRSLGGSVVSTGAAERTSEALKRTAGKLSSEAHPVAQTPEGVGEAIRRSVKGEIKAQKARADESYGQLRALEEAATPDAAPAPKSTVDRAFVMRWLADDLREMPFQQGRTQSHHEFPNMRPDDPRIGAGGYIFEPHTAGTHTLEMFQKAGFTGSRAAIASQLEQALTGKRQSPRLEALADALVEAWDGETFNRRQISDATLVKTGLRREDFRSPMTVPNPETPGFDKFMGQATGEPGPKFAVDLRAFKESMQPIAERLQKKREMTGALLGGEGRAAMALDALLKGPDIVSLSVADAALSDLKGLARGAVMPELRSKGQGVAAAAVRDLDTLVQLRAEAAGPEVFDALQAGRAATIAKYGAADVLKRLRTEPVQIFNQATWARDAGIDRLRDVAKLAPAEMPALGRAYLDDLFDTAGKKGGFEKTGTIATKWQNLGPETKKLLFPNPALRSDLDKFFLLAEKMATNPNPSGTGYLVSLLTQGGLAVTSPVTLAGSVLAGAVASKAMHSPRVVRLLTQGLKTPARSTAGYTLSQQLRTAIRGLQGVRQATSPTGPQTPSTEPAPSR